jgi:AcrR family transcriptional regulator
MKAQRVRLYTAATRVFAKRGFSSSTVDDVCTEAGISRRTFYEHFEDLHDLLVKLHDRLGKMAFAAIETYVNVYPRTDAELRTRAGVEGILGLVASFPAEAKIMFRELRAAGPQYEARREALLNRFAGLVAEGVEGAHAAGTFSVPPDEIRVFAMVSAIESVGMRYVERGEHERAREAAPALIDMLIRTFK